MIFIFKKAQIATEYLVVAGLVLLIVIPLTFLYIKYTTESDYAITTAKVSSIANEISKAANSVYVYGQDSQLAIDIDFPRNLQSISIPATPGNKDIVFKVRDNQGNIVDIVKQADVSVFAYGTIPITPGRKKLVVKSLGTQVLVQIPCDSTQPTQCIYPPSYPSCTGPSCLIQCINSVWTIIDICAVGEPCCGGDLQCGGSIC